MHENEPAQARGPLPAREWGGTGKDSGRVLLNSERGKWRRGSCFCLRRAVLGSREEKKPRGVVEMGVHKHMSEVLVRPTR